MILSLHSAVVWCAAVTSITAKHGSWNYRTFGAAAGSGTAGAIDDQLRASTSCPDSAGRAAASCSRRALILFAAEHCRTISAVTATATFSWSRRSSAVSGHIASRCNYCCRHICTISVYRCVSYSQWPARSYCFCYWSARNSAAQKYMLPVQKESWTGDYRSL